MSTCQVGPHPWWGFGPCLLADDLVMRLIWREELFNVSLHERCRGGSPTVHRVCQSAKYSTRENLSLKAAHRHRHRSYRGSILIGPSMYYADKPYRTLQWFLCWYVFGTLVGAECST